ncbi:aldo/keto reductase [Nocardia sp. NBC_01377]|uniref:aldo/keto reductase n=1 Tax=Nocardia sp. NBC_01377 TaxID=2903595 RepID=UPI0038688907
MKSGATPPPQSRCERNRHEHTLPFTARRHLGSGRSDRHLGVSNATAEQVVEAQGIAPIVSVQNMFDLAHRHDDELIDRLALERIAYVPFFPLGGFSPVHSSALSAVATRLDVGLTSVALAWLLRRSPNILLIPGTCSIAHLRENIAARLSLSEEDLAVLDEIGRDRALHLISGGRRHLDTRRVPGGEYPA